MTRHRLFSALLAAIRPVPNNKAVIASVAGLDLAHRVLFTGRLLSTRRSHGFGAVSGATAGQGTEANGKSRRPSQRAGCSQFYGLYSGASSGRPCRIFMRLPPNPSFQGTAQSCALGTLRGCAAPAAPKLKR